MFSFCSVRIKVVFLCILCYDYLKLNREQYGAAQRLGVGAGKREAGVNPARSRHCDRGVCGHGAFCNLSRQSLDGKAKRLSGKAAADVDPSARKPACCWYRGKPHITRNW